jgi:hypothetical protein
MSDPEHPEHPENPENPKDQEEQEDPEEQQEQDLEAEQEAQDQEAQDQAQDSKTPQGEETVVLPLLPQLSLPSSMRKSSRVKEAKRNLSIAQDVDMKTLVHRAQQRLRGEDRSTSEMRKKVEKKLKYDKELYEAKLALLPLAIEVEQLKDTYKAALKKRKKR